MNRYPRSLAGLLALAAALGAAACTRGEAAARGAGGPALVRLDSVELVESDTLFIGRPRDIAVNPADGTLFVSDGFANRVVRFDRAGRPLRSYGRAGTGPGEFVQVSKLFVIDTLLLAGDIGRARLNLFRLDDGRYLRNFLRVGVLGTSGGAPAPGLLVGAQNIDRGTSLLAWTGSGDSLRQFGPIPPDYFRSQPLAGIFNGVHPAAWADTVLVGFGASPDLWLLTPAGQVLQRIRVPAVRRKGVPDDMATRIERLPFPKMFSMSSVLFALRRLSSGEFAMVHFDQEIGDAGDIHARVFVSLLSRDRTRTCVDRDLPVAYDTQPHVAFRGDTLFVLEQSVQGERATTFLKTYRVDGSRCEWQPVGSTAS